MRRGLSVSSVSVGCSGHLQVNCTDAKQQFGKLIQGAHVKSLVLLALFVVLAGCSSVPSGSAGDWAGHRESGKASYYADKHQNMRTASGEPYKHDLPTAAHKQLPFGSMVKVTNTANGKSVVVRINDRGPFVRGRIIDLSKTAFSRIGSLSSGLLNVEIEVLR